MIFAKSSVGVEICDGDLRAAIMRSSFGKLRLIGVHQIAGFMGLSEEERKKAVRALFKNHRVPATRVYLALPREQGIVRQVDLPAEMTQKLADVVKFQVETLSPWPLDEIYWDSSHDQPKKNRKLSTVTIAIIPRSVLDPWIVFFKSAGIPLSGAALSSLAYAHGSATLWKDSTPNLILHCEQSYVEGVLVSGTRVAALTAPASDGSFDGKSLVDTLLSVAKLSSAQGARFVVCGGNPAAASRDENPRLPIEDAKPESAKDFGPIATSLLPLKGSAFKANLVPSELRHRESQVRLIPTYVLGLLTICMGMALVAREPYQTMLYASRLESEIRTIAPQVSEVADQEDELNQLSARLRAFTATLQGVDHNLEAMRELVRILPPAAFLASYAYQDGGITISGFAPSASEIQSFLESSSMFKSVEFTNSVTREATGKDRFTMKMVVEVPQ